MKRNVHFYVSPKNGFVWLMALCLTASALARIYLYNAAASTGSVWLYLVLPVAATVLYVLPEAMRGLQDYRMILYAVVLIVVMLFTWSPKIKEVTSVIGAKVSGVFKKKEAGTNE